MQLSRATLPSINAPGINKPDVSLFQLPEKVLQFGTGVLLRGLCDYFIHKANQKGFFNGRIVVVKSTDSGESDAFREQDDLYTLCVRSMAEGRIIKENTICAAISRVISARDEWEKVLETAHNPLLRIVISNTTEVGIQLVKESIHQHPPLSFPAKLLAFLYRRFTFFKGSKEARMVVIPTELITDNGKKLKAIVEELAAFNQLGNEFRQWMKENVSFCNSLVDRIVTKDPGEEILKNLQEELGYQDKLLTMCEDYRLWAIEGAPELEDILSFTKGDNGVFVKPDIEVFKSLKLHLLNGTHTLSASLACLSGFETVKQAMEDQDFSGFIEKLMLDEIGKAIPYPVSPEQIKDFGSKVLDRFRNPFLKHNWINITFQNTAKMRMRNVPVLKEYHKLYSSAPKNMTTGFAAFILFMRAVKKEGGNYYGNFKGKEYKINDDQAPFFYEVWQRKPVEQVVEDILGNRELWGEDLSALTGFKSGVQEILAKMINEEVVPKEI